MWEMSFVENRAHQQFLRAKETRFVSRAQQDVSCVVELFLVLPLPFGVFPRRFGESWWVTIDSAVRPDETLTSEPHRKVSIGAHPLALFQNHHRTNIF